MNQEVKMHETMRVGILLAFVGGFWMCILIY